MSPRSTKILRISGIVLLVLMNITVLLLFTGSVSPVRTVHVYNPCLAISNFCGDHSYTYTDWNLSILSSVYILVLLASLGFAIKKGHRAWWYNIFILGLAPLGLFLSF
jgi:hypothetical protein